MQKHLSHFPPGLAVFILKDTDALPWEAFSNSPAFPGDLALLPSAAALTLFPSNTALSLVSSTFAFCLRTFAHAVCSREMLLPILQLCLTLAPQPSCSSFPGRKSHFPGATAPPSWSLPLLTLVASHALLPCPHQSCAGRTISD